MNINKHRQACLSVTRNYANVLTKILYINHYVICYFKGVVVTFDKYYSTIVKLELFLMHCLYIFILKIINCLKLSENFAMMSIGSLTNENKSECNHS